MAVVLLLSICGCAQSEGGGDNLDNPSAKPDDKLASQTISLLYSYSDSFNPYLAKTSANRAIASLLYDSLVMTDNNFEPVNVLASSVEIDNKTCTVKLKTATFSDGSAVTADDVVYSYNTAKASARYTHNFYEVASVSVLDTKTVVFNLSQCDPYFANLLTFPIVK